MNAQQKEEIADAINVIAQHTNTEPMEITKALVPVALTQKQEDDINEILCDL